MPTPRTRLSDRRIATLALAALAWLTACERPVGCTGDYCGTLVIATAGEPDILLPVVSEFSVTRDVADRLFLKLADVGPSGNTSGDEDFQPQLAERWEWDAPTTLVFHLDPRARWQDGQPVTAADVAFTYDAYTDTLVNSPFRPSLRQIAAVTTRDSLTVVFRFRQRYPEMFYDAVYHLRILPAHLLRELPRTQWRSAPFGRAPVGDGPYRFVAWKAGESIEIAADSTFFRGRPHIRRVIWRFTPDQTVAVTQLIAGDADAVEVLVSPDNVQRACAEPQLACYPYKGAAYGYVAFNLAAQGDTSKPHPLFGDRDLRRALVMATDRERLLHNVFGDLAKVPPGPMPQLWWIWDPEIRGLPDDSGQAARLLTRSGWIDSDGDGIRDKDGHPLSFRLLVPHGCCRSSSEPPAWTCRSTRSISACSPSAPARADSTPSLPCGTRTRRPRRGSPRRGPAEASGAPITAGTTIRTWTGSWTRRSFRRGAAIRRDAPGARPSRP